MASKTNKIKFALSFVFLCLLIGWALSGTFSTVFGDPVTDDIKDNAPATAATADGDYVGSEACQACHEDQAKNFEPTKHAKLKNVESWKNKVVGCESCHGPGRKHVEDATVPGAIISFKKMNSKAVSETCLSCHAGKESHNNFRRGEHWRNDVGCTDCHSPHSAQLRDSHANSITFIGETTPQNPGIATVRMLRQSEPQLCISCHNETKSQFNKPFHHKVLEGTMKCSDCHNPHGGFELKQARLAVGADASCIKCHSNKAGPFAFEHAPLKTEGCSACHTPHGSNNPKMLNRSSVRQMCFECHSAISEQAAPNAPSFHNQANVRYLNCTICHTAIHGSNANNRFLR
jgi:predicted CXXCH cytochrome family protein